MYQMKLQRGSYLGHDCALNHNNENVLRKNRIKINHPIDVIS